MKQTAAFLLVLALLFSASTGDARNTVHQLSVGAALAEGEAKGVLIDSIALYFGDQATPAVEQSHGQFTANRKTNAFNKSDEEACNWVFLTAIKALQDRARAQGGNAVINIYSYYYKNEFVSETEFECGAGAMVAGVTMIGDVVTIAE